MAKAAIDCKTTVGADDIEPDEHAVSLLLDVLDHFKVSPKEACDFMKIDRSKFTRFRTKEARPTWAEVLSLPPHIWLELRRRVEIAKGLDAQSTDEMEADALSALFRGLLLRSFKARRATA